MLNDNGPTHCDSFSHLDPDPSAETIDQMPLDLFYGPAVCLDITGFAPRTDITAEDLDRVEADSAVEVRPGDIVLFYTGTWNRFAGDKRYLSEFPGLGESAGSGSCFPLKLMGRTAAPPGQWHWSANPFACGLNRPL